MRKSIYPTPQDVADAAIDLTLDELRVSIANRGLATWVLAGGTSPSSAYKTLASRSGDLEWQRVAAAIGDERHVPLDDPDSNWGQISSLLFSGEDTSNIEQIVPVYLDKVEDSANDYESKLKSFVGAEGESPRLDVVWLGVGEDGHTLSLFPNHSNFVETDRLVVPVYDSPKPPSSRISLTLRALSNVGLAIIFATGAGKKNALDRAESDRLPIFVVAQHIESHGGRVEWLYDDAAA